MKLIHMSITELGIPEEDVHERRKMDGDKERPDHDARTGIWFSREGDPSPSWEAEALVCLDRRLSGSYALR